MSEITTLDIVVSFSFLLPIAWLAFLAIISVCCMVWDWIDDKESFTKNPVIKFFMLKMGFPVSKASSSRIFVYEKDGNDLTDGGRVILGGALIFAIIPTAIYLYEISMIFIVSALLALLARFARRSKKMFDLHIKDKDAHK